jgi:HlyD family secretion protein
VRLLLRRSAQALVALGVVALLTYAFWPQPVEVDLARAVTGPLRVTVDERGKTRVKNRYVISAPLHGQVLRIDLKPGHPVYAGKDVLAVLEPTEPALLDDRARAEAEARVKAGKTAVTQASARLERARAAHRYQVSELERVRRLYSSRSVSRQEYDNAVQLEQTSSQDLRAAEFGVRIAEFELDLAQAALVRTRPRSLGEDGEWRVTIRSPITGRVLRVHQESAAVVTPGTKLLEVGDPTDLEAEIEVLSADAVKIRPGARVLMEHWGGTRPLEGRVRLVEPSGFLKVSALGVEEQRVYVIADFDDPPAQRPQLGDAYRVEARVVIWEGEKVLKVPAGALFRRGDAWAVFVVRDGKARLQAVQAGHSNGLETEVLEGLQEGDPVILHPSDKIADGVAVRAR